MAGFVVMEVDVEVIMVVMMLMVAGLRCATDSEMLPTDWF